jgi:hypothetical protein
MRKAELGTGRLDARSPAGRGGRSIATWDVRNRYGEYVITVKRLAGKHEWDGSVQRQDANLPNRYEWDHDAWGCNPVIEISAFGNRYDHR